jgi:hypothetical protein
MFVTGVPSAFTMGLIGSWRCSLISAVPPCCSGSVVVRSLWLCNRNDVAGNLAVLLAASGVFATGTAWRILRSLR